MKHKARLLAAQIARVEFFVSRENVVTQGENLHFFSNSRRLDSGATSHGSFPAIPRDGPGRAP